MPRPTMPASSIFARLFSDMFTPSSRRQSRDVRKTAAAPAAVLEPKVMLAAFQNFDGVAAPALPVGWTQTATAANTWTTVAGGADAGTNRAFVAGIAGVSDSSLTSPSVFVDGANGRLSFRHSFVTESGFDGGVLEISINGGAFQDIITAGGTFINNGYSSALSSAFSSPIGGRDAWNGDSAGYITTIVDVPAAAIGQNVQFRWRFASDTSTASTGWSIDTIELNQLPDPDDQISEVAAVTPLNTTITGVLDNKLDVDLYKFTVTAGQTLQFDLDTAGLATPLLDSVLRLFNAAGNQLTKDDDSDGYQLIGLEANDLESFIQYTFAAAGTYYVGVSGFDNSGYSPTTGNGDVLSNQAVGNYQLHIGTAPTATIAMSNTNLREHGSAVVTITFDQAVTNFSNADLTVENGTLTNVTTSNGGVTWKATYKPTANIFDTTNVITLNLAQVTDLVGTPGVGTASSPNYSVDTIVDENDQISEAALLQMNSPTNAAIERALDVDMYAIDVLAGQTLQFDIDTQGFATPLADSYLRIFNSAGTVVKTNDDAAGRGTEGNAKESFIQWTFATAGRYYIGVSAFNNISYNPTTGDNDVNSVLTGSYTLHVGTAPTATITMSDYDLLPGDTALVTIAFSEAVLGFTNADLTVENGTLTNVASADGGKTWTATFTPTAGVYDTTNVITLNNTGVTDTVGTPGAGTTTSPNYQVGPAPNSAQLAPDPLNPGEMYLLVNGTSGNDVITVTRPTSTSYNVVINGVNKGTFTSPSGIVVYGQDGNDKITLASNVTLDSLLDGGSGADTINGGGSNSVMLGGTGNDTLTGFGALVGGADNDILKSSGGRSLLIGGAGADNLTSQFGNDILIGGTTDHDTNPWALASIREEWNQNTPVATRIANLAGLAGGGLNGTYLLVSDAVRAGTVHNDFAVDKLSNNSSLDWILPFSGDLRSKIIGQVNHA
ncbi:MAG: DVUA0089 family protein [Planctomycetaceae bacterium]